MNRLQRARRSLEGLSVGDSFGERFFVSNDIVEHLIKNRAVPHGDRNHADAGAQHPTWQFTDDTMMALSIYACLEKFGGIEQDWLIHDFARLYDSRRGYGPAMHRYLETIRDDGDWRVEARTLFGGSGSFGNGAAMRAAPLGAFFADDLDAVVESARLSAEVTHAHSEGIAGAIAVAVAAAVATTMAPDTAPTASREFLATVLERVPDGEVAAGIQRARTLPDGCSVRLAVSALGNGTRVSAQDTVPFALWCAAQHMDDFQESMWMTVSGLGDRDTTCAIVGGIVACRTGVEGIPHEWLSNREPLPNWVDWFDATSPPNSTARSGLGSPNN